MSKVRRQGTPAAWIERAKVTIPASAFAGVSQDDGLTAALQGPDTEREQLISGGGIGCKLLVFHNPP